MGLLHLSASLLLIVILIANRGCADQLYENYYGFRVYRARPTSRDAAKSFEQRAAAELKGSSILKIARQVNDTIDLLVAPHNTKELELMAKQLDIPLALLDGDFQRSINASEFNTRRSERSFSLFRYNSHQEMDRYLQELARRNPTVMTYELRGKSYEGRNMKLVRLSSGPSRRKPAIFIDAGIHAREWFAPVMAIQLVQALVEDPRYQHLLKDVDWYVLPMVNPDGYEFSRSSKKNRLWRKTRSRTPEPGCYGVDGNRNYGYQFAVTGATTTEPCHPDIYAGPKPFSEPETKIVRDIIMNTNDLKLYISLHAYGQYLVYPWGYTESVLPPTWRKLHKLAKMVSNSVVRSGGEPFKVMSAGQWYPAAGGSDDYAFSVGQVPYAYTMELTDNYGFLFPESGIREALSPLMAGFKTFGEEIAAEFGGNN